LEGDVEAGSIRPEGLLSRKATVSLPEVTPLSIQLFIVWLAIILWRREANAGAAAAVSAASST
ncbi:MAG: hypothetical protein JOZ33_09715, partial [Acidobacteriaceae bacterium]|nr:hypothetical protein [Acidobacteriaceae bacterium]